MAATVFDPQTMNVSPISDSLRVSGVCLDSVPGDIHHMILSDLVESSPSTVIAVAQSSNTLRENALPFVYQKLVLHSGPKTSTRRKVYNALVKSIHKADGSQIAKHIRNLTVKDDVVIEDLAMILNKISEHGILHKLKYNHHTPSSVAYINMNSWNTSAHMPKSIFEKIHSTWPDLEISVCVVNRDMAKDPAHRQMDTRLLSSPLLIRLTYVVYYENYRADQIAPSEWPKLTQALAAGGSVRFLRLQSQADGTDYDGVKIVRDTELYALSRLDVTHATRLPPLEELSIRCPRHWGQSTYLWDTNHCQALRDAMDWSHLRKLDFGGDNPEAFFSTFTGLLPDLKALRFGATDELMESAKNFIDSVTALESLDIAQAQTGINALWPVIEKQKSNLKELIFRPTYGSYYGLKYIDIDRLKEVATTFPSLERLGWDVPCNINIDSNYLAILSSMNLKKLDVFLHLPGSASDYSEALQQDTMGSMKAPPLNKDGAKRAAINIAETISNRQAKPLEWLTLHFGRTGYQDRAQTYLMQAKLQLRRDKNAAIAGDDKYEVRGNQNWFGLQPLEDELLLEED